MNLNDLARRINDTASRNGFWEPKTCNDNKCYCEIPREPLVVLALIHSEVSEATEEIRDGLPLDHVYYKETPYGKKPMGVPSEMADIIIRVLDACAEWGIDIETAVQEKMAYNAKRQRLHGRTC